MMSFDNKQSWFAGDSTKEEADELLSVRDKDGKTLPAEEGAFLIRFSAATPGAFAISYRTFGGSPPISHALVEHEGVPGNYFYFD